MLLQEIEQRLKQLGYNLSLNSQSVYFDGLTLRHSGNINENLISEIISLIQSKKQKIRLDE